MKRIYVADIILFAERAIYKAGSRLRPSWGAVSILLSTVMVALAIRLLDGKKRHGIQCIDSFRR